MQQRVKITIRGAVQGVGFRPFIFRLADELKLKGWVTNSASGVFIEAEAERKSLDRFLLRIEREKPRHAVIQSMEFSFLDPVDYSGFEIRHSDSGGEISAVILPDIAVCEDCLREMNDPSDRRYRYPFINCTNCGPRFSIIEALPYDRPNTSMKQFEMCPDCRKEYEDPSDRRFHAQPVACPVCGPQLTLCDEAGRRLSEKDTALRQTAEFIRNGKIVALKGLGGFQLLVDARSDRAVQRLRRRKRRAEKPFAIMAPDLNCVQRFCFVGDMEARSLRSPESPIVLLLKSEKAEEHIAERVAPQNPWLGVMLPYTPLHHLLMWELGFPVVATSANLSEEPMVTENAVARDRLSGIADVFLFHNRPIVRQVDDSIVRIIQGREMLTRRARGYAPLPVTLEEEVPNTARPVLALGAHLKSSIAVCKGDQVFVSQHIGDLSNLESVQAFEKIVEDFTKMYDISHPQVVADLHPDYVSTQYARNHFEHFTQVQHHEAHVWSCRAENRIKGPALGISWDGTSFGGDGTIWGGEVFISDDTEIKHIGGLRSFSLPGGEKAVKEPRRAALGLLFELFGDAVFKRETDLRNAFSDKERPLLKSMLVKGVNSPRTSSMGRLFDAVSALLGICMNMSFEGQAAMMLEFRSDETETGWYSFSIQEEEKLSIDWQPVIENILSDLQNNVPAERIAARFHNGLARIPSELARRFKLKKVLLSGGCFQNIFLLKRVIGRLRSEGVGAYWHQRVPPNDGGIALGQVAAFLKDKKLKTTA